MESYQGLSLGRISTALFGIHSWTNSVNFDVNCSQVSRKEGNDQSSDSYGVPYYYITPRYAFFGVILFLLPMLALAMTKRAFRELFLYTYKSHCSLNLGQPELRRHFEFLLFWTHVRLYLCKYISITSTYM